MSLIHQIRLEEMRMISRIEKRLGKMKGRRHYRAVLHDLILDFFNAFEFLGATPIVIENIACIG